MSSRHLRRGVPESTGRNPHHRDARPSKILRHGKFGRGIVNTFLAVINLAKDPQGLVCIGHRNVLRARFTDARFFWESDQKCKLADYLPKLQRVTYESRLAATTTRLSACGPLRGGWRSSGSTWAWCRRTWPMRTAPPSWRSATWPRKWCGSSRNCRASWAGCTQGPRAKRKMWPMRCTTTTCRWGLMIPSRGI